MGLFSAASVAVLKAHGKFRPPIILAHNNRAWGNKGGGPDWEACGVLGVLFSFFTPGHAVSLYARLRPTGPNP